MIRLSGAGLTRAQLIAVARGGAGVEIEAAALARVAKAADFLGRQLSRGEPIYGVTTGFGSNADRLLGDKRLRPERLVDDRPLVAELQRNLIISHAVCVGPPLPEEVSRAMLLIRINTLLGGHSGIRPGTVERLAELLNLGLIPAVPEKGSVGASGDLAPLSHLALPLLGLGEVWVNGVCQPAGPALAAAGLEPLELSFKEGLALNNGTALMLALGVLAIDDCERLVATADLTAAVTLEAFCGRSAALDERVHALRPHPGQVTTAARMRDLVADSGLVDIPYHRVPRFVSWTPGAWPAGDPRTFDLRWDYVPLSERAGRDAYYQQNLPFRGGKKFQPQDAYSLRCIPQVHGAVRDTLRHVSAVLEVELNSVTDNPLIFPGEQDQDGDVLSAGNFHGMPLALALASLKSALPVLASIAERRLNKLVDPATNDGLPPFLIGNEDGTDSGMMIVQYSAASLVNDLAARAQPAAVYSVPTSANAEDHVSMGANDAQTIRAFMEAEAYDGPSLILAYSHCVAHGYDLKYGLEQQKAAVDSAYWPLYRFNPDLAVEGKNPFSLDSRAPKISLDKYIYREGRYRMLTQSHPERAAKLLELAQADVEARWEQYSQLAKGPSSNGKS